MVVVTSKEIGNERICIASDVLSIYILIDNIKMEHQDGEQHTKQDDEVRIFVPDIKLF